MSKAVKLIECPRDAWQGLKGQIPSYIKIDYLKALISAGLKHMDAASFVSPKAVPQMADAEEVRKELDPPDDVEIICIVVNDNGAERAIGANAVRTLGFPYSVSPTFLRTNRKQALDEAIDELEIFFFKQKTAYEVDPELSLIKGGGGALLREKIVAAASRDMVVIA